MSEHIELELENDNAKIVIFGKEYDCFVNAKVKVIHTKGCHGWMKSGSSSYEDLGEPPSAGEVEFDEATCTVEIFEKEKPVGTLTLEGEEWFDVWFDEIEEMDL